MKKHVYLNLKTHFDIFCFFVDKPKYWCTTMYACEKSPPPLTIQFFSLTFVPWTCCLYGLTLKVSYSFFFWGMFFGTSNVNGPKKTFNLHQILSIKTLQVIELIPF
jgi:hypothetical protein